MKKLVKLYFIFSLSFATNFLFAGERTIPVDIFLMIDKSLSMEDPGKFDSLQRWVLDELIGQMLIKGDWITIYQFYEKPEHLISTTITNNISKQEVYNTVKAIKPDGQFTDIGYALDTIQKILDARGSNGRFKVLLLLSDLVQDAPWTSKYRGKQDSFKSPYLVEARTIRHDNWYEITLDMDIQDAVVQRTQALYSDVLANEGVPRSDAKQDEALIQGKTNIIVNTSKKEYPSDVSEVTTNADFEKGDKPVSDAAATLIDNENSTSDSFASNKNSFSDNKNTEKKEDEKTTEANKVRIDESNSDEALAPLGKDSGFDSNENNDKSFDPKSDNVQASQVKTFFSKYWPLLLIGFALLILLIILILFIIHMVKENQRKKEAEKEKITLV